MIAGSERLLLDTTVPMRGEDLRSIGEFTLKAGDEVSFVLNLVAIVSSAAAAAPGRDGAEGGGVLSGPAGPSNSLLRNIGATLSFVRS